MKEKIIIIIFLLIIAIFVVIANGKNMFWNTEKEEIIDGYIYKGNANADAIEIGNIIKLYSNKPVLNNLKVIKNELENGYFKGIKIELKDISPDNILTIDLIDGERKVTEFLDAGSAGGKISLDILTNSFLQPEIETKNWISGLKILLNGEENAEGNHFNLDGIFNRSEV